VVAPAEAPAILDQPITTRGEIEMHKAVVAALAATAMLSFPPDTVSAAEVELRTAGDLMNVCAVPDDDPRVEGARGFCYGFLSGAAQYHRSVNAGKKGKPLFCPPEPRITRAEAAKLFVAWGRANPQYLGEAPVDALTRFAVATWPCKQAKR
jgi:hypothetical protein